MFHVKHSNKICWPNRHIRENGEKIMNELMTLSEDEIKHLIKVMKEDGIGDSYTLDEVDKLW